MRLWFECINRVHANVSNTEVLILYLLTAVKCPDVYAPTYGSVDANSTIFQSKVRYYCDHGYKLYGSEYRTCDYTGQWTEEPPTCKRKYFNTKAQPQNETQHSHYTNLSNY